MPRVLIVDDNELLVETYREALTAQGFVVATALEAELGLHMVAEFHPDVVLLEMMMPELDGLGFLSFLPTACEGELPRVIATSSFPGYRAEALARGAYAFVRKPIGADVLLAAVAAAVPGEPVAPAQLNEHVVHVAAAHEESKRLGAEVVGTLNADRMRAIQGSLQALVEWLQRYYGFGQCFLHLVDGENFYLQASAGTDPRYMAPGMRYPRSNLYCGDVVDVGATLYLSDPLRHPVTEFAHHNEVRARGWHFYVGAPLVTPSGAVLGTLCLMDRTPRRMHPEDVRLFEALAAQVAAMIADVAAGRPVEQALIDVERVFHRRALELLIGIALRRTARARGRLELARFTLRDKRDYAAVARKAYGVTSGLRFAVAAVASGDLVMVHDGDDPAIVLNNTLALWHMIEPSLRTRELAAWSLSQLDESVLLTDTLSTSDAHAIALRLLGDLGVVAAASAA